MFQTVRAGGFLWCGMVLIALVELGGCSARNLSGSKPHEPTVLQPDELVWAAKPSGVKVATLYGDPSKPGPFVLRLRYPPGYRKGPHYHPENAYVTVLSGSYFRGYGNEFVESTAVRLSPGTFSVNPARVSHYEWTTEPAELEVHAVGPWATVYVDKDGRAVKPH